MGTAHACITALASCPTPTKPLGRPCNNRAGAPQALGASRGLQLQAASAPRHQSTRARPSPAGGAALPTNVEHDRLMGLLAAGLISGASTAWALKVRCRTLLSVACNGEAHWGGKEAPLCAAQTTRRRRLVWAGLQAPSQQWRPRDGLTPEAVARNSCGPRHDFAFGSNRTRRPASTSAACCQPLHAPSKAWERARAAVRPLRCRQNAWRLAALGTPKTVQARNLALGHLVERPVQWGAPPGVFRALPRPHT